MKKPSGRRNHFIGRNMIEWDKRTRSTQGIIKGRQTIMGRRWNHLCEWKNLCVKQPKNQGENTSRKL